MDQFCHSTDLVGEGSSPVSESHLSILSSSPRVPWSCASVSSLSIQFSVKPCSLQQSVLNPAGMRLLLGSAAQVPTLQNLSPCLKQSGQAAPQLVLTSCLVSESCISPLLQRQTLFMIFSHGDYTSNKQSGKLLNQRLTITGQPKQWLWTSNSV